MPTARSLTFAVLISGYSLVAAAAATAQSPSRADAPPPPRLEKLEEGEPPAVAVPGAAPRQPLQESREHGVLPATRVETGRSTYYIAPNTPKGSAHPGDLQSTSNQPAQWKIFEFNTQPRQDARPDPAAASPAPPTGPNPAAVNR